MVRTLVAAIIITFAVSTGTPWRRSLAVAWAQQGLRSASLPDRTPPPLPSERPDVFVAPPGTYVPNPRPPIFNPGFPVFGSWPYGYWDPYSSRHRRWHHDRDEYTDRSPREVERPPAVAPAPAPEPEKYVAGVPGKPKTFYVIPGCYAGDRPPERDRIPQGCDVRKLRKIPPVS
jgi:hypothetical protein